ncbi:hypothetical protein PNO31109_02287 [Pandoraea nosoerga]|uniref:Uncharacterized protein n=1 Tax=Pandoraea nosoerga TaxID=2508296 RepID=A0A5E4UZY4_9BURK|nr:hypothetical protein PNO31109_02287 [Pandoraea nosoerga]
MGNLLAQIAVCGGDHAHVARHGLRRAKPQYLALLQHAQQARLQRHRHFADFVQENRAVVGRLEKARLAAAPRAGERPFLVAEQLALEQGFRKRRAVDRHERIVPAPARVVNALREQFLAGAALAVHEHRGIGLRVTARKRADVRDGGGVADQIVEPVARHEVARAMARAQRTVHARERLRVLAGEQCARERALVEQRDTVDDPGLARHRHDRLEFGARTLERAPDVERRCDGIERATDRVGYRHAEHASHRRIDRLDPPVQIHRRHTLVQVSQHRVEPLAPLRLDASEARDFERGVEGGAHRVLRVEEDAGHTCTFGQFGHEPGADHDLDALVTQAMYEVFGIVRVEVGVLGNVEMKGASEPLEFRRGTGV